MWWLFSNKKKSYTSSPNFYIHDKIRGIEDSLKNSFFNIKKDIVKINSFLHYHDNNLSHLKERISFLEENIHELKRQNRDHSIVFSEKEQKEPEPQQISEEIVDQKPKFSIKWEDLTNIQQNLFLRLGLLQIESFQKRIAMKHLAEELYPEKEYNDVRSMISDYINLLNEYGLIKKSRKGRQIFVSITEKGSIFYDKTKRKKLLEIITKK